MKKMFFLSITVVALVATTQKSSAYTRSGTAKITGNTLSCPWSMDWCFSDNDPFSNFKSGKEYTIHTSTGDFKAVLTAQSDDAVNDSRPDYEGAIEFTISNAEEVEVVQ